MSDEDTATIKVTDASFEDDVLKSEQPVVVDFWAQWCGPCLQIAPALEELAADMRDTVTVAKINIDENQNTPMNYNIRAIPTLIMFKAGEVVSTRSGSASKAMLADWIKENV